MRITEEEIDKLINRDYGKGYRVKLLEVIERRGLTLVRYRVTSIRDGFTEYRVKGWGTAMSGWDYPYRRKW